MMTPSAASLLEAIQTYAELEVAKLVKQSSQHSLQKVRWWLDVNLFI